MQVRVLLFGAEARSAGRSAVYVELPPAATCAELRARLAEVVPALTATLPACRFAVNHVFAPESHTIAPGDEVALIGLVSGG